MFTKSHLFSVEKPSRQAQRTLAILSTMMVNLGNSARSEGDVHLIKNEPITPLTEHATWNW
jgi:hypothetical protein